MRRLTTIALAALLGCGAARLAKADPPTDAEKAKFFEEKVQPVLVARCYECHSQEKKKIKGKFRVDDYESMLKGGESKKPGVVPGKPDESFLFFSISYVDKDSDNHDAMLMPPMKNGKSKKLPDSDIANIRQWIADGAVYPKK